MKNILLTLFFAALGSFCAMANNDIIVIKGSLAPLAKGGKATVVINMDECTFDNKMPLREDERYADADKYIPEYQKEFVREFNEHCKKFSCTGTPDEADYSFTFNISNMDTYVKIMSFKPGCGTKLWGTMTILDKKGNTIAVLKLDSFESSGFTYNLGLEETYEVFAKKLAKRINKEK
ncbi:hypothetical protein [Bacteroides caecimuris]|uniref:hypothetical protein n=1 Tax=Bacteroides caecimuris TaxID=1796613 RepID=UPI00265B544A|nr:hypothetical protein [Bacteroides caecimuris]